MPRTENLGQSGHGWHAFVRDCWPPVGRGENGYGPRHRAAPLPSLCSFPAVLPTADGRSMARAGVAYLDDSPGLEEDRRREKTSCASADPVRECRKNEDNLAAGDARREVARK